MNLFRMSAIAVAAWLGSAVAANAQPQTPITPARPTFSPYLNLLRNDSSMTLNYYGLVRPQQQFQQSQTALAQSLRQTNQAIQDTNQNLIKGADPSKPVTGHSAVFNNTMSYFGRGGGGGGGGFAGARITAPGPQNAGPIAARVQQNLPRR